MPTYQYQCTDCGEALEIRQSFTDDTLTECPACGGALRKVFNAVGVVFKGSGFYRNDSRPKDSSTSSSSSESGSKDSGSKDSAPAASKPAPTTTTTTSSSSSTG